MKKFLNIKINFLVKIYGFLMLETAVAAAGIEKISDSKCLWKKVDLLFVGDSTENIGYENHKFEILHQCKIEELDKKLEDLPNVREELVSKYRLEKEIQLKNNESSDYLEERSVENSQLFKANIIGVIYKNLENEDQEQKLGTKKKVWLF